MESKKYVSSDNGMPNGSQDATKNLSDGSQQNENEFYASSNAMLAVLKGHMSFSWFKSRIPHRFLTVLIVDNTILLPAIMTIDNLKNEARFLLEKSNTTLTLDGMDIVGIHSKKETWQFDGCESTAASEMNHNCVLEINTYSGNHVLISVDDNIAKDDKTIHLKVFKEKNDRCA